MIFDFLDGFSARMLKAYSAVGKELDSLADVVSFGVAPGIIIYNLLNNSLTIYGPLGSVAENPVILVLLIPALMAICAALRLAIFNLDVSQATVFKGLPTPANALAVISVIIAGEYTDSSIISYLTGSTLILSVSTVILSLLMVSRIPLLSLKMTNLKIKGNEGRFILAGVVIISLLIFGLAATPLIIPLYIIVSVLSILV
jgi:CDP-diacylglycerol--serine O-phosphatidyltransferase